MLLGVAAAAAPALSYAQHGGFGGGGHAGGGGGAHFGGGGGHFAGGHAAGGFAAGAHYAAPHFAAPGYHAGFTGVAPHVAGFAGGAHFGAPGVAGHGFVGHAGSAFAPGNAYWHGGHYWGGGYWNGRFWPHVWFNPGFSWFLPILPLGYATFWWGGLPYYYWNNLYYTWNPAYNGYVVSDPPPAAGQGDTSQADSGDPDNSYATAAPQSPAPPDSQPAPLSAPMGGGSGQVFLYPRNGQSDAQAQNDRFECHSWAVNQTGFDPTRSGQSGSAADYRRAMIACLDARGYSAR